MREAPLSAGPLRFAAIALLTLLLTAQSARAAQLTQVVKPHPKRRTTINLVLQSFFTSGNDAGLRSISPAMKGVTRLGWSITQRIGPRLRLGYARSYLDETRGRITNAKGQYVYPPLMQDRFDDLHVAYPVGLVHVQAGYAYRQRICCLPATGPATDEPAAWHEFYLQGAASFGPRVPRLGRLFTAAVRESYMPHDPSQRFLAALPRGMAGERSRLKFSGNLTAAAPVGTTSFSAFATYGYNSSYLENAPYPYLYNQIDVGVFRNIAPGITTRLTFSNRTQHRQGYPYVYPNTVHRAEVILTTTIHVW